MASGPGVAAKATEEDGIRPAARTRTRRSGASRRRAGMPVVGG